MFKLAKKNLQWWAVILAVAFLIVQVSADLYLPTVTSDIINKGVAQQDIPYIWHTGAKMLLVAFIGVTGAAVNVYFASTQSQKMGKQLRFQLFEKITNLSNREFDSMGNATMITRTTNDVTQIQNVMQTMLRMMIMSPIMLIGAGIMAYTKDHDLTIVFAIALPILAVSVVGIMYFAVPLFKSLQKKTDRINLVFQEGLTGVRVIRAFNQDNYEQNRFDGANEDMMKTARKVFIITSFMFPIMTFVLSAVNIAIVWFGAHLIGSQSMEVGNLVAFMTYATQILMSFMQLSMVFVLIPRAQASAVRINEVLALENSVVDPAQPKDKLIVDAPTSLAFDHVDFRYSGAEQLALNDIHFTATAGQTVAIIGGTGSGKSTLVNLIPRLYDIEAGTIKLNGQDIRELTQKDLHNDISITQQKAVLFTGTVRSNLQYGKPDATEAEMWHALDLAQASEFIREQGGLDLRVEQNGDNFSGGQRQRLAIARTLIKPAPVYIFDDSFSALDFKTDAVLRAGLKTDAAVQQAITVLVAQRISTVADADIILVLEEGRVVGQGTHQELAATNATYQEIIDTQIKKGSELDA